MHDKVYTSRWQRPGASNETVQQKSKQLLCMPVVLEVCVPLWSAVSVPWMQGSCMEQVLPRSFASMLAVSFGQSTIRTGASNDLLRLQRLR
jgi:hypothetical protein